MYACVTVWVVNQVKLKNQQTSGRTTLIRRHLFGPSELFQPSHLASRKRIRLLEISGTEKRLGPSESGLLRSLKTGLCSEQRLWTIHSLITSKKRFRKGSGWIWSGIAGKWSGFRCEPRLRCTDLLCAGLGLLASEKRFVRIRSGICCELLRLEDSETWWNWIGVGSEKRFGVGRLRWGVRNDQRRFVRTRFRERLYASSEQGLVGSGTHLPRTETCLPWAGTGLSGAGTGLSGGGTRLSGAGSRLCGDGTCRKSSEAGIDISSWRI